MVNNQLKESIIREIVPSDDTERSRLSACSNRNKPLFGGGGLNDNANNCPISTYPCKHFDIEQQREAPLDSSRMDSSRCDPLVKDKLSPLSNNVIVRSPEECSHPQLSNVKNEHFNNDISHVRARSGSAQESKHDALEMSFIGIPTKIQPLQEI